MSKLCDFCCCQLLKNKLYCMNCTSVSCSDCSLKCNTCDNYCCKFCADDSIGTICYETQKTKKRTFTSLYYYCYKCK